jgi:replicative DNA helicase
MKPNHMPTRPGDEEAIIGSILIGGNTTLREAVEAGITPESFDDQLWAMAFRVALQADSDRRMVTSVEVIERMLKIDPKINWQAVDGTQNAVGTPENITYHTAPVVEASQRRSVIMAALRAIDAASNPTSPLERAQQALQSIKIARRPDDSHMTAAGVVAAFEDDLGRRRLLNGDLPGVATGFREFDRMTSGLQFGELSIIGARPSVGKTALAIAILQRALTDKVPVLFVTLEMSPAALIRRMASASCRIPLRDLRDINPELFDRDHVPKLAEFDLRLIKAQFSCINGVRGITVGQIETAVARAVEETGCRLVILDYLQKVRPEAKAEKRTYEVGAISGRLKEIAATHNVAMLSLAQLNRESDQGDGRLPRLSDLADSGQIERDADLVALLHRRRDEDDPNGSQAKLIVAKQRDGEVGIVPLEFEGQFCEFRDPRMPELLTAMPRAA